MRVLFLIRCVVVILLTASATRAALNPAQPYDWKSVRIGGGGFVPGLLYHPTEKGLFYARTDVGGAYRWNNDTHSWKCLTDFIGAADVNLTGIESLAIDPSDPARLYLAAGTYTNPRTPNGAMFLSSDRGETFHRVDLPFKLGGNEAGRGDGERLAVDPHHGATIYFGSRAVGLWRSDDFGKSWKEVKSFPAEATSPATQSGGRWNQPVGIVFVIFDEHGGKAGEKTPVLFAGISSRDGGLYESDDAGKTWTRLAGQPTRVRPQRAVLGADRWLYLTFGDEPAPNGMSTGAVWRYHIEKKVWEEITPLKPTETDKFGYGGLALDPSHPGTLLVATYSHYRPGDEIFRSRDGGKTWKALLAHSTWDHRNAPWTQEAHPHWMADIKIDPFDENTAWFGTGYGVWKTENLTAADRGENVNWNFADEGFEETVPLGLISPPVGAHLISAVGDLDGFRHDDLNTSPLQLTAPPRFANSEDIVYAGQKPEIVARTGTIRNRTTEVTAAYSTDGGNTWRSFATAPSAEASAGSLGVSSDGAVFIWATRGAAAMRTLDHGATWQACENLPKNLRVIFDQGDALRCYAFDERGGGLWTSEDAGAHFSRLTNDLPKPEGVVGGFGGGNRGGGVLYATPEHRSDLWIAFRENGLLHSLDGGKTFTETPGVQKAFSFGFGKAKEGQTFPALFLAGTIENIAGLFRSDDSGKTWTRINDDQHQFGWITHVTGDPRIAGRVYFGTSGRGIFYGDPK